jgi:hypothetical protein
MKLFFQDLTLASLDALDVDSLLLLIAEDVRPLRGLGDLVDWRLCGAVSRVLKSGRFRGEAGEALLLPGQGRLPVGRIFCFGVGKKADLDEGAFREASRRAVSAVARAGSRTLAAELWPALDAAVAAEAWLAACGPLPEGRVVMLGDPRKLLPAFRAAVDKTVFPVELPPPPAAAPPPPRPPPVSPVRAASGRGGGRGR